MTNRLAGETSPYLLQHADNPVDWYPWGEEALARARAEDKPILLSIGYATCHWCHVMERESFEDPETAALMNELYVNVKVDREERPDLDAIYMEALVAMTGSGGWPMTLFLTPEGKPFTGGTYFPREAGRGLPAFRDVLRGVADSWRSKRETIAEHSAKLLEHLRASAEAKPSDDPLEEVLPGVYEALVLGGFDHEWGGWGRAPKFPPASTLEYLLRRGDRDMTGRTLDKMALGGMYDLVGGGFHRYAVDRRWLVPHFEKMLYDNALLASAYLHGYAVHGEERYRRVVEETIGYMLRELALPEGGFASGQDADTNGVEGLTYTWRRGEAGIPDELLHHFEHDRFVLRGELDPALREELLALRAQRPQPLRDDKAIASWNGLALAALAECGRALGREDWIAAATRLGEFLLGPLSTPDGRLHRLWRNGVAKGTGYLSDYADVANGLYELHVATGDLRWLREALRLAKLAVRLHADDEHGGFFDTPADGEALVVRKKSLDDNPAPSGNAMLAYVLLRLARIYGDDELEARAVSALRLLRTPMARMPSSFSWGLVALDLHLAPRRELAIIGRPEAPVARAALSRWDPRAVVAFGPADDVPLLRGKTFFNGRPAVYVCERFACRSPIVDPAGFA
jgi:uncharacterized protein YyaL (SSP411 family)